MRSKKSGTPQESDLVSKALKMPSGWGKALPLSQHMAKTLQPPSLEDIAIYEFLFNLKHAEKLSEMLRAKGESLNSIQEELTKKPVDAKTLAMLISLERNRPMGHLEEYAKLGIDWIRQQQKAGFGRHKEDQEKHKIWRRWQEEAANNPKFAKKNKQAQAAYLKGIHSIEEQVGTIAKRLLPASKKK